MSDIGHLRELTDQVRRPALAALEETAHRRSQRAARVFGGATLVVLLAISGAVISSVSNRSAPEPVQPPDPNQTVVDADYGAEAVHHYDTYLASNSQSEHAGDTDLTVSVDAYSEWRSYWWCDGDINTFYVVQVINPGEGLINPEAGGPVWRAGGACGGTKDDRGQDGHATPPPAPSDAFNVNGYFMAFPGDVPATQSVRIVLTDRIPDGIAGCFDLPGGPIPEECINTPVTALADAGNVTFGAVIYSRQTEYVTTVAGAAVEAESSYGGNEYLFAGGVESKPGAKQVTIQSQLPGYVYVVQSDPVGNVECQAAFEAAKAEGREWIFEGDSSNWPCTIKTSELRLLVDGRPVAAAQQFGGPDHGSGIEGVGSASLDAGTHEITLKFVSGDPRIRFGLVLFTAVD
jgi:hypothetical protein